MVIFKNLYWEWLKISFNLTEYKVLHVANVTFGYENGISKGYYYCIVCSYFCLLTKVEKLDFWPTRSARKMIFSYVRIILSIIGLKSLILYIYSPSSFFRSNKAKLAYFLANCVLFGLRNWQKMEI